MKEEFKGMSFWLDSLPEPAKLVLGLALTVERLGVKIYEQSPVTEMMESGGVKTAQGEVL